MTYTDKSGHTWREFTSPEGLRWERDDGDVLAVLGGYVVSINVQGISVQMSLDVLLAFAARVDLLKTRFS
jgi:hypothetical protein